ncbi:MAG: hypothetical protein P8Y49_07780 [Sulfurovaceae bacterium]
MKFKLFVKIYLVLFILGFFYLKIIKGTHTDIDEIKDFINYLLWSIVLIGVYGYAFDKNIFNKKFWQFYLFVIIVWEIYYFFTESLYDFITNGKFYILVAFLLLSIISFLPAYITLYLYGYQNESKETRKKIKITLFFIFLLLITNSIASYITSKKINRNFHVNLTKLDAMYYKAHENNNTKFLHTMLFSNIRGFFYYIGDLKDIEEYSSICREFDNELYNLYENDLDNDSVLECNNINKAKCDEWNKKILEQEKIIQKGKDKIKQLCEIKAH